jgi:prepilin-type N-terminal cleavage/methylation domain-containing protein
MQSRSTGRGFSILEVLVSLLIISILVGLLIPCLIYARDSARTTLCAGNLRQISNGWQMYLSEWNRFPRYPENPEWKFGGVVFRSSDRAPVLASDRPINRYIADEDHSRDGLTALFRCPSDAGVFRYPRGGRPKRLPSVLARGTCYETFGSSYRANRLLLDSRSAGMEGEPRPLRASDVVVSASRLIVLGDPEWFYATRSPDDPEYSLDATWHVTPAAGNVMTMDGAVRFVQLGPESIGRGGPWTLHPRR